MQPTLRIRAAAPKSVGCHLVSRDGQPRQGGQDQAAAVIVVTFPMPAGVVFDWHTHPDHQLAWAASGEVTVRTSSATLVLPPTRELWIPAGLPPEQLYASTEPSRPAYLW